MFSSSLPSPSSTRQTLAGPQTEPLRSNGALRKQRSDPRAETLQAAESRSQYNQQLSLTSHCWSCELPLCLGLLLDARSTQSMVLVACDCRSSLGLRQHHLCRNIHSCRCWALILGDGNGCGLLQCRAKFAFLLRASNDATSFMLYWFEQRDGMGLPSEQCGQCISFAPCLCTSPSTAGETRGPLSYFCLMFDQRKTGYLCSSPPYPSTCRRETGISRC